MRLTDLTCVGLRMPFEKEYWANLEVEGTSWQSH
jgi:hypothetical protein